MDSLTIGLRSQDFQDSLKEIRAFGPKDVNYKHTLLIGKAASLAMHLRGLIFIDNITQLEYAASSLGISSLELPTVLRELEAVDFLSVVKKGEQIKRVDLRIPEFRSAYADLGDRWLELKPTSVEDASMITLDQLHKGPISEAELRKAINCSSQEYAVLKDIMSSGQLLSIQTVDGEPMVYTPLAVDGNPHAYLQWAKKFPGEVQELLKTLQAQQGLPLNNPVFSENPALKDAIGTGVLMPVQVDGATGEQNFLFAPRGGLRPEERSILDKARAIVSSVRYGQNFSAGRRILYPKSILQTLRERKQFKKGHPDLFSQYGLLTEKLIGHPIHQGGSLWNFRIDDTDENMKALDIAIEMIEHGESPSARIDLDAQRALLAPTGYLNPTSTRPHLTKTISASSETRAEIIRQMANLARGMSHE